MRWLDVVSSLGTMPPREQRCQTKNVDEMETVLFTASEMSYISQAIGAAMSRKNLTQADVVKITGIDKASLSRWLNGQRTNVSDDDLNALARLGDHDREKAAFTVARMMDAASGGPCGHLVRVEIGDDPQPTFRDEPPASHPFERALAIIRANHSVPEVQDVITSLAALLETGDFKPLPETYRAGAKSKLRKASPNN